MIERQRLNVDLQELFPGGTITIGTQTLNIRPLGIRQLTGILAKIKGLGTVLTEDGITWDNYRDPTNFVKISTVLSKQFPESLEEASNIALEDLQELPIEVIVSILDKVIEVNMKSKEALLKNFDSLVKKFSLMKPTKKRLTKKR